MNAGQLAPPPPPPSSSFLRWVKQQCEFAKQAQGPDQGPRLDLSFKEGQTITLNIAVSAAPCSAALATAPSPAQSRRSSHGPPCGY